MGYHGLNGLGVDKVIGVGNGISNMDGISLTSYMSLNGLIDGKSGYIDGLDGDVCRCSGSGVVCAP